MEDKSSILIDCDAGTISVYIEPVNISADKAWSPKETRRSELIATILTLQARELLRMTRQELMARHLVMLEDLH